MVKIKKNAMEILDTSSICTVCLLGLSLICFLSVHKDLIEAGLSWLFGVVPASIIVIYLLINVFYNLCGKTYYEFRENEIALIKNGHAEKIIKHDTIVKLVYEKGAIFDIRYCSNKLGELMVVYEENNVIFRHRIEIPFFMLRKTYLYNKCEIIIGKI